MTAEDWRTLEDSSAGIDRRYGAASFFVTLREGPCFPGNETLPTMKTIPAFAFIAALVAFVLLPVNFVATVSLLFGAGLAAILISDYSRAPRLLKVRPARVAVLTPPRSERFGLAA